MPTSRMSEVIQHLRTILVPEGADLTDGQLLEGFLSRRESAALEVLVRRHAPMVWGVCCRVLGNHHDAEDAFQATFLVLVRKAASICPRSRVGNWLYGVAHRTALKARATRAKRKQREGAAPDVPEPAVKDQDLWNDLQALLDQEVSRLPEKYRTIIVLCELEGKTIREAARQIGCPEGTVASRLARARALLAKRLGRHGLALTGGALASILSQNAASASVPAAVLAATIKVVNVAGAGQAVAAGLVSAKVAALTDGVLKGMLLSKLRAVAILLFALSLVGGGTGLWCQHRASAQDPAEPAPVAVAATLPIPAKAAVADPAPKPKPAAPPTPLETRDDGSKPVLPAEKAPADAPLRPLPGIPTYQLSDARLASPGPGPGTKLIVHYERMSGEELGRGPTLVIRTPDGNERNAPGGFGPFEGRKKAGDFVVPLAGGGGVPKNLEVYLVHVERRWEDEGFRPRFKVSNSVVIGALGRPVQLAREWTAEETAKLTNPPPEAPKTNAHRTVGEDTAFIGNTTGLLPPLRYADPARRPVVGVLYRAGQATPEKGRTLNCLIHVTPAYDVRQPRFGQAAVFAKPGYALGALKVKTQKVVIAVQAVFMRQQADGTLDPATAYTSQWLGYPEEADNEGSLDGEGRKVIGMHLKHLGMVHALALVLE